MSNARCIKGLIWAGFTALLAVSVPKVAWVFRSYENATPVLVPFYGQITFDLLWFIPLFVSFCIDALILSLTYTVTQDKQKASQIGMWVFVAALCTFSYYCNLLYNLAHAPNGGLWTNPLVTIVTPLIISGVPLFALSYTLILSRLEGKGETLEEKATRLASEKEVKERIKNAKKGTGMIASLKETAQEIKQATNDLFGVQQTQKQPASEEQQHTTQGTQESVQGEIQSTVQGNVQSDVQEVDTQPEHDAISNIRPMRQKKVSGKPHSKDEQKARRIWTSNPNISARALAVQISKSPTTANNFLRKFKMEQSEQVAATGGQ